MKALQLLRGEFSKITSSKPLLLSVCIMLCVPLVYVAILLSPKWGPYDNLDNVPVAIVNNDTGAISNGVKINIGDDLVEDLKVNKTLGWYFTSSEEAARGMKNLKYYMTIEVPENFSEKVVTVLDDDPQQAELIYTQNEGLHFLAAQVTGNAIELIRTNLSEAITETYAKNVFTQIGSVADGFQEAAAGSGKIYEGSLQLKSGTGEIISTLQEKSGDISRLADGAEQLQIGTGTMLQSLLAKQNDISKLAQGAKELNAGTGTMVYALTSKQDDISKLAQGAKQLNTGTGQLVNKLNENAADVKRLSEGARSLETGTNQLSKGANEVLAGIQSAKSGSNKLNKALHDQLVPGSKNLANGLGDLEKQASALITGLGGASDLETAFAGLIARNPEIQNDPAVAPLVASLKNLSAGATQAPQLIDGITALKNGAQSLHQGLANGEFSNGLKSLDAGLGQLELGQAQVSKGANDLAVGASQLSAGNQSIHAGWQELTLGVNQLHAGASQVNAGNKTVNAGWNELSQGASQLHEGASQISEGNNTVASGWQELSHGTKQLYEGATQISEGNNTVKIGWDTLTDGVGQVDDGLQTLSSGSEELYAGLQDGAEQTADLNPTEKNMVIFASPVVLNGEVLNSFPLYRDFNAPYIITLALFVGMFIMSFIVPFKKPAMMPTSAYTWYFAKVLQLSAFAIIQALIVSLFVLFVLGIEVHSTWIFILYTILISITFLMILLFLVVLAGNIGRFIALAFVIIQLSTTGTQLPIVMLPESLRTLSNFLPFTYSIDGLRNIITLGNFGQIWANLIVLVIIFIGFALLALATFLFKYKSIAASELVSEG